MSGPGDVEPVIEDGVRYEAVHWGKERGFAQNGGIVAARDEGSGEELWTAVIYEIEYGPKSPQKYDRFITRMDLVEGGEALRIMDESGAVHRLDLSTREVETLSAPPQSSPKPNPRKPT
ncbi:hypothetical protein RM543_00790 [Roseicyclus sp. F158]|uniref:Uncharacterized protein n=1 Tax=Tropicimonas omnivorans TaxID=3075590 RepID=A0ABU3DBX1_9RHOB|nr:hypothetical protein [Roseicyclus sp. F158]MDT0681203.1 hypothetical protein [Roseicyclus sp. F158]